MKSPLNIKDIVFENIKYIPMKNGKSIMLRYLNNYNKFLFQTPELKIKKIDKNNEITILHFNLDESNSLFINFLVNLDKNIVKTARLNNNWFKSNNISFKGLIRYDEFKCPYFKLKFKNSYIDKLLITSNKQSEKCLFTDLKIDLNVKMIIDINGLWINDNSFGIYLKPLLIDIRESYDLILNDSSEDDILETDIFEKTKVCSFENINEENNIDFKKEIKSYFSESSENKDNVSSLNDNSADNFSSSDKLKSFEKNQLENEIKYD